MIFMNTDRENDEGIRCKHCGSDDVVEAGLYRQRRQNFVYRRRLCMKCGKQSLIKCSRKQGMAPEEIMDSFPVPEPMGNPFSWQGYNEAQTSEKLLFLDILEDLCSEVQEVPQDGAGRPRSNRKEMAFCLVAKLYEGLSSRRVSSDLQIAMLKRKFSSKLKLKNEVGQLNEALAMVLCHNICVLIKEIYANDVEAEFKESAHLFPSLHIKELSPRN